jgi:hypothetical protein
MVTNNRIWVLGAVIIMIAILAMGWFLGASPMLTQAAANDEQRASVEATNAGQEATLASLAEQFKNFDALKSELTELQKELPPGADLSTFIGELHALEAASGVTITTITASDAAEFVPPVAVVETPVADATATEDTTTDEAATVPTEAPVAAPISPAAADAAALPAGDLIVIELSLEIKGTQEQVIDFIDAVQNGTRLFLVTGLTIAVDETDGGYTAMIPGNVYVLIDPTQPATKMSETDAAALAGESGTAEETPAPDATPAP